MRWLRMEEGQEFNCVYGSDHIEDIVFSYKEWYCIKGSVNVNRTHTTLFDSVDVEGLTDYDVMTAQEPINTLKDFVSFIDD